MIFYTYVRYFFYIVLNACPILGDMK